jgi:surfactin synthase thioesterase subunit
MGATIAFEIARELRRRGVPGPALLGVSAMSAPQLEQEPRPVSRLSDAELLDATRQGGGLPEEILQHEELLQLVLPTLRADLELIDAYAYVSEEPLTCPIRVFGANRDPLVQPSTLDAWSGTTTGRTTVRICPGDHFFLWEHGDEIVSALVSEFPLTSEVSVQ